MIQGLGRGRRAVLLAAASIAAWAGAAQAQDTSSTDLSEVVVTAQRRAEKLEDVPISMTVATGEQIERAGVTRLEDLPRITPGLQISRTGFYTQPAIRGITTLTSFLPENNVAIYVDGVYVRSPRATNLDLVNLRSVQVLKGPQGTLFGRNATGGAILIETLQPSLTDFTGQIAATYARFDDKRIQGYVSVPVSEVLAVGLTGSYRKSDGYLKDVAGFDTAPLESYSLGAKARLELGENTSVTAKFDTSLLDDGRGNAPTIVARSPAAFIPGAIVATGRNQTSYNHPVENPVYQNTGSLRIEHRMGWANFTSTTSYQNERGFLSFESDGTNVLVFDSFLHEKYKTVQQEFNLSSSTDGPLQYVAGFYYYYSKIQQYNNYVRTPQTGGFIRSNTLIRDTDVYAPFADVTWRVSDRLFLTGGLRYSHEKAGIRHFDGAFIPRANASRTFKATTPRAVVRYEIADDTNVYASWTRGFKAGYVDVLAGTFAINPIRPEKIDAYEIGFKTARSRFRFDASAYYYDYKDLQVGSVTQVNGITTTVTTNAATAEIYGAEAQFAGEVVDDLNISVAVAYTHARYKRFPNALVNRPDPVTGLNSPNCRNPNAPPATIFCTEDWSGRRLARAPDWTINVGADYTIRTGAGDLLLAANGTYSSAFAPARSDIALNGSGYRYEQPATFLLNMRAAWTLPNDKWTLTAFGNNITDEVTYAVRSNSAFGDSVVWGEPRTYGVRVDYRF